MKVFTNVYSNPLQYFVVLFVVFFLGGCYRSFVSRTTARGLGLNEQERFLGGFFHMSRVR